MIKASSRFFTGFFIGGRLMTYATIEEIKITYSAPTITPSVGHRRHPEGYYQIPAPWNQNQ